MFCIPDSTLRDTTKPLLVRKLPLGTDINEHIIEYIDTTIDPNDTCNFWIQLGEESCLLRQWSKNCMHILQHAFKPRHRYCRHFNYESKWIELMSRLDDMLQANYPRHVHTIKGVQITHIFYSQFKNSSSTCSPEKFARVTARSLTEQEKLHIFQFIQRFTEYLDFLDIVMKSIHTFNWTFDNPAQIKKTLRKMRNKHTKTIELAKTI